MKQKTRRERRQGEEGELLHIELKKKKKTHTLVTYRKGLSSIFVSHVYLYIGEY